MPTFNCMDFDALAIGDDLISAASNTMAFDIGLAPSLSYCRLFSQSSSRRITYEQRNIFRQLECYHPQEK